MILYQLIIFQIICLFCFSYCTDFITVDGKRVISPAHILNMRLMSWSTFSLGLKFHNPSYWHFIEDGEKIKRVISWENSMTNTLSLKEIQRKYDLFQLIIHQIIFLFCFSYCSDFITVDDKRVISPAHILNMRSTFSLGLKFQKPSYWNVLLKMVISWEHERLIICP